LSTVTCHFRAYTDKNPNSLPVIKCSVNSI